MGKQQTCGVKYSEAVHSEERGDSGGVRERRVCACVCVCVCVCVQ